MLSLHEIDNLEFFLSEYTAKLREIITLEEIRNNPGITKTQEMDLVASKIGSGQISEKVYLHLINEIQKKDLSQSGEILEELLILNIEANNLLNEVREIAEIPSTELELKKKQITSKENEEKSNILSKITKKKKEDAKQKEKNLTPNKIGEIKGGIKKKSFFGISFGSKKKKKKNKVGTKFSAITLQKGSGKKQKKRKKSIFSKFNDVMGGMDLNKKKGDSEKSSIFEESFKVPVYSVDIGLTDSQIKGNDNSQSGKIGGKDTQVESLKKSIFSTAGASSEMEGLQTLIPGYAYGKIEEDENGNRSYIVLEPALSQEEQVIIEGIKNDLINVLTIEELSKDKLFELMEEIIREKNIELDLKTRHKLVYYLSRDLLGLSFIEPIMHDPMIEDIECDGINIPVYVIHKEKGHLPTNIIYRSANELEDFIVKLSQLANSYVSYASPLLNAILPDGSRVNAVLTSSISTKGPSFTLRLFPEKPLSPVNLIINETIDPEMLAYLWTVLDYKKSVLIAGPTASGKTTMLNALAMFLPYGERIVSIEDTRELNLQHENWLPQVARPGFGPPDASGKRFGEVSMMDLIRESFRQRPDYLVVGEVRGKETFVLFQGMASGHCAIATMHARSVNDLVSRLTTPPINLSPSLLESVDVVLNLGFSGEREIKRRVRAIAEIERYDPHDQHLKFNDLAKEFRAKKKYESNDLQLMTSSQFKSVLSITEKSLKFRQISEEYDLSLEKIQKKVDMRTKFLEKLKKDKVIDFKQFIHELEVYKNYERKN